MEKGTEMEFTGIQMVMSSRGNGKTMKRFMAFIGSRKGPHLREDSS